MNVLGPGPMLELWNILDFSVQIVEESYIFLISFPEEESRLNAIIRPYTLMVMYVSYIVCCHIIVIYMHIARTDLAPDFDFNSGFCWLRNGQTVHLLSILE